MILDSKINIKLKYLYLYFVIIIILYNTNERTNSLNIDTYFASKILDNTTLFKNIHPNFITLSGLLSSFYIYYLLNLKDLNIFVLIFFIFFKWLTDILDGAVARKYNKTSKLGSTLDSIADSVVLFVIFYFSQKPILDLSFTICILISLLVLFLFIYYYDIFNTHNNMEENKNNDNYFISFLTKNTLLIYILFIIHYINFIKK